MTVFMLHRFGRPFFELTCCQCLPDEISEKHRSDLCMQLGASAAASYRPIRCICIKDWQSDHHTQDLPVYAQSMLQRSHLTDIRGLISSGPP